MIVLTTGQTLAQLMMRDIARDASRSAKPAGRRPVMLDDGPAAEGQARRQDGVCSGPARQMR